MKKIYMLISSAVLLPLCLSAQPVFQKTYLSTPSIEGIFAGPSSGGGIITCGKSSDVPCDAMLMKTDPSGTVSWAKTYGGSDDDIFQVVRPTSDGGYIAVGSTKSYGAGGQDVLLVKLDGSGNVSWTKTYGTVDNDWGSDVIQTTDGGYAITGSAQNAAVVNQGAIYLIKTTNAGVISWSNMWGMYIGNAGMSVIQTSDGGYICAGGASNGFNSLIKTNSAGVITWARANKATLLQAVISQQTIPISGGGYLMVGQGNNSSNDWLISLAKTDASGVVLWTKTYTTPSTFSPNYGCGVAEAWDGSYLIAGQSDDFPAGVLFIHISSAGAMISAKLTTNIGSQSYDVLRLSKTSDGGFVAAAENNGVYLLKCDGYGNTGCTTTVQSLTEDTPTFFDNPITNWVNSGATVTNSPSLTGVSITPVATTLCTGTDIEEVNAENFISVYPDPSSGLFNLEVTGIDDLTGRLEIYNAIGEKVFQSYIDNNKTEIDLSLQQSGIYLIKIFDKNMICTQRIIKQ
jgi:hypothetical protein